MLPPGSFNWKTGLLPASLQEIIVGVVGGVAVEFVELAMVPPRARLERHDDGSARSDAVIGLIIASQRLEFGDCILRRQNHKAAAAAAIVLLRSIDQVDVVGRALPVEADAVGRRKRIDPAERRQVIRHPAPRAAS